MIESNIIYFLIAAFRGQCCSLALTCINCLTLLPLHVDLLYILLFAQKPDLISSEIAAFFIFVIFSLNYNRTQENVFAYHQFTASAYAHCTIGQWLHNNWYYKGARDTMIDRVQREWHARARALARSILSPRVNFSLVYPIPKTTSFPYPLR